MTEEQCLINMDDNDSRSSNGNECSVCTDKLEENVINLPCGEVPHQFHVNCVKALIEHNQDNKDEISCPMCRKIYKFKMEGEYAIPFELLWPIYKYSVPLIYTLPIIIQSKIVIDGIIFYNWYSYFMSINRDLTYVYLSTIYMLLILLTYFSMYFRSIYAIYSVKHKKYDNLLKSMFKGYPNTIADVGLYVCSILIVYVPIIIYLVVPDQIKYDVLMLFIVFTFVALLGSKVIFQRTTKWYSKLLDERYKEQKIVIEVDLYKTYSLVVNDALIALTET